MKAYEVGGGFGEGAGEGGHFGVGDGGGEGLRSVAVGGDGYGVGADKEVVDYGGGGAAGGAVDGDGGADRFVVNVERAGDGYERREGQKVYAMFCSLKFDFLLKMSYN